MGKNPIKPIDQEAEIRMRAHHLQQVVDDRTIASCQRTCCKWIVKTCNPQACCKLFHQDGTSPQMTSGTSLMIFKNSLQPC